MYLFTYFVNKHKSIIFERLTMEEKMFPNILKKSQNVSSKKIAHLIFL
jgi:hypothetical protein